MLGYTSGVLSWPVRLVCTSMAEPSLTCSGMQACALLTESPVKLAYTPLTKWPQGVLL